MSESSGKSLSWPEVQEICGQLEGMFHDDALKDAQRLRVLIQNRKDIASAFHTRQRSAQKLLAHLHANLREWEEKEQMAKKRNEQLHERLQQLDTIKRDVAESLDMLMSRYDETKQELLQYHADHQNDIPVAKNQMSLYASVTGIRWDFSDMQMAGDIHVPAKKQIVRFHIDPAMDHFTAANTLWDKIDEAFDDINSDM
uniref:Kinetochore protein Spc24 n=1 Tax=Peronospora matthiolae TaxID=2874970 RepID=A0AAV1T7N6_9STRA